MYGRIGTDIEMLTVSKIYDDDYGCEERMPNASKMAIVYLKDDEGNEKELKVPDDFLVENGIEEGKKGKAAGRTQRKSL